MSGFGVCPVCRRDRGVDVLRNIRSHHFICCDQCRVYWYVGQNLLSGWTHETVEIWEENARVLDSYRKVNSLSPSEATVTESDQVFLSDLGVSW